MAVGLKPHVGRSGWSVGSHKGRRLGRRTVALAVECKGHKLVRSLVGCHIHRGRLSCHGCSLQGVEAIDNHPVAELTREGALAVESCRGGCERNLSSERPAYKEGLEVGDGSRSPVFGCGFRYGEPCYVGSAILIRIVAHLGCQTRGKVDGIEGTGSSSIGGRPIERVGLRVDFARLEVAGASVRHNSHTGAAYLGLATRLAVDSVEIAVLSHSVCITILGNAQGHIGVGGLGDGGAGLSGVIDNTPLQATAISIAELAEDLARVGVLGCLYGREREIGKRRGGIRHLPRVGVYSEVIRLYETVLLPGKVEIYPAKLVAHTATTRIEERLAVIVEPRDRNGVDRGKRMEARKGRGNHIAPKDQRGIDRRDRRMKFPPHAEGLLLVEGRRAGRN